MSCFQLGRVGSTFQLSVTFSILIGEVMNYLMIPSFNSDTCIPLTNFSWRMQICFCSVFGLLLLITLLFGPNPKRRFCSHSSPSAGQKRVASSLSLSAQEYLCSLALTDRTFIEGRPVRNSLFSLKVASASGSEA